MTKKNLTVDTDPREGLSCPTPVEKLEEVEVLSGGKKLKIGSALSREIKKDLIAFLKSNLDVFTCEISNMPGVDLAIITHCLSIKERVKPVV